MILKTLNWTKRKGVILACIAFVPLTLWIVWERMVDIRYKPITATGTIQAKEIAVASKVGGRIAQIRVKEGQEVKQGDVIIEFEIPELEARERQCKSQVEMNRAELEELVNGPRPVEIDEAKAAALETEEHYLMLKRGYRQEDVQRAIDNRKEAQANLALLLAGYRKEDISHARSVMEEALIRTQWLQKDQKRFETLASEGAVSLREAEDVKSRFDATKRLYLAAKQNYEKQKNGPRVEEINAARARLEEKQDQEELFRKGYRPEEIEAARQEFIAKQAHLDLLLEGTRRERLEKARAQLKQAEAMLSEVQAQVQDKVIVAPAPSEVSIMDLHKGELVAPNKSVVTLTRLDDVWTRVYMPARELARVSMGQEVDVKVDSFPRRIFKGHIVQIPSVAEFTPRNVQTAEERSAQVFGLKVQIENPDHVLRGGMNAEISFLPVTGPLANTRLAGHDHGRSNSLK